MNVFKLRKQQLKTQKNQLKNLHLFNLSFPVETRLRAQAYRGDLEALFQVGLRALIARQFGIARQIFQEAKQKCHPLADIYFDIASQQLSESPLSSSENPA